MTTQQLRLFLTLADVLSFSKTAEILYTSQSTISKQIAQLENELDATLLERRPHQVALTPAGRAFAPLAHKILGELDVTTEGLRKMTNLDPGLKTLEVSCDPEFWDDIPLFNSIFIGFQRIQEDNPSFKVLYSDMTRGESVEQLRNHQLDLRFVTLPEFDDEDVFGFPDMIGIRRLSSDRLVFAYRNDLIRDRDNPLPEMEKLNLFIPSQNFRTLAHGLALCRKLDISPPVCFFSEPGQGRFILGMGMGMILVTRGTYESQIRPQLEGISSIEFSIPEAKLIRAVLWAQDTENESTLRFLREMEQLE